MTKPLVYAVRFGLAIGCAGSAFAQSAPPANPAANRAVPVPGMAIASELLSRGDRDAAGKLSREEWLGAGDAWFEAFDPDRAGRLRQDEFLQKFESLSGGGAQSGARRISSAADALGFFSVTDQNHDAVLTVGELKGSLENWFGAWDSDKDGRLDRDEILKGLNAVLPRTNMSGVAGREAQEPIAGLPKPPPSPVLSPEQSMATIAVAEGFNVELAASEPMIEDPVALTFDEDGRAYVVEMRGFMLDIDRTGEREPISRISLLQDTDGDGRLDRSSIFVDGLILPRAVAAMAGGIFYVSDFKLYFARDTDGDGRADINELVDADYGKGNVEHGANAFFRAMDNWIYNGESPYRYRLINGALVKQVTEVRGQWGMTQDDYGRLIYNVNNSQLLGDFAPPNYMGRNSHHPSSAGINLFVATDQRVFPIRMTTAVNRGYSPEVLDAAGKSYVFASSCSPLVYRGDNYPSEFLGNAFVCDPALNLIKRNVVVEQTLTLTSNFAYEDREFLASTDERFRPANLYNGPDGVLWVVDLYRGIAQYGQFMTKYLRRETLQRGLEKGIHQGRIYRIVSTAKKPSAVARLSGESSAALVGQLASANGWTRDTAQRLLVERGDRSVAPALMQLVATGGNAAVRVQALWTIEGLFATLSPQLDVATAPARSAFRLVSIEPNALLSSAEVPPEIFEACLKTIADHDSKVQVAAIRVTEALAVGKPANQQALLRELARLEPAMSDETRFQAALTAGNLPKPESTKLLAQIATRASEHLLIREAIVSGLEGEELRFVEWLVNDPEWKTQRPGRAALLQTLANAVLVERDAAGIDALLTLAAKQAGEAAWRRRSLLEGIATAAALPSGQRIALSSEPAALSILARSDDASVKQQAERIGTLFTWPGHPADGAAAAKKARALTTAEGVLIEQGKNLFQQLCAGCHGIAGQGTRPMAPPLVNSEWVLGPESRIIRIALHGIAGPIHVGGVAYQPPNILPEMPPLAALDDAQLAGVLSYVRRAWGHEADPISPAQVAATRASTADRKSAWTEDQLSEIK